jgi:hypothetical protein
MGSFTKGLLLVADRTAKAPIYISKIIPMFHQSNTENFVLDRNG